MYALQTHRPSRLLRRWEQVFDLWQEGYSIPQIARYLGIGESQAWTELATAQAYEQRGKARSRWERLADGMAAVYPDDTRRNWIYRQMGVERRDEHEEHEPGAQGVVGSAEDEAGRGSGHVDHLR